MQDLPEQLESRNGGSKTFEKRESEEAGNSFLFNYLIIRTRISCHFPSPARHTQHIFLPIFYNKLRCSRSPPFRKGP